MRHTIHCHATIAASAFTLALLVTGCKENLMTGPARFDSRLALHNWSDTVVLGERRRIPVRVLDDADHEVVGHTVQWTNATPAVLEIALAAGASAGGSSATAVASTDSIELYGHGAGTSDVTFQFADALFNEAELTKSVTVVAAGVRLLTAPGMTLSAIGDTAVLMGSAMGRDTDGVTLVPVFHQGVTWTQQGDGAVTLTGAGDTVRVEAVQAGTDTVIVTHARCLDGAQCADTAIVTVSLAPTPGGDLIVLTDIDVWNNDWGGVKPENQAFAANVVGFTGSGPRASGHTVMYYSGTSPCGAWCPGYQNGLSAKLTDLGYTISNVAGSLATIPSDVKVVFLIVPGAPLGQADLNGLKQFASEGGRVVLITDNDAWLSGTTFEGQNQILSDLGVHMTINPGCAAYYYIPAEGSHQATMGVSQLYMACASTITMGPGAYTLFRDPTNSQVVVAVAKIDVTPLP